MLLVRLDKSRLYLRVIMMYRSVPILIAIKNWVACSEINFVPPQKTENYSCDIIAYTTSVLLLVVITHGIIMNYLHITRTISPETIRDSLDRTTITEIYIP